MKYFQFFLIAFSLFAITSCGSDGEEVLNYDGANFSAPEIIEGNHEAAARFSSAVTSSLEGRQITSVDFFIQDLPDDCEVRIYEGGTPLEPGDLIYAEDAFTGLRSNSWNTHTLITPFTIGTEDIWVSIFFRHDSPKQSIGCDSGPADSNGDLLWGTIDYEWRTFRDRTSGQTDINWNIRAIVAE